MAGYTTRKSLLDQVQAGNEEAWEEFYQKYRGMIASIGKKRNLSEEERDELVQDVMKTFWDKMDQFTYDPDKGRFRGYLSQFAHYASMKKWNKRGAEIATEDDVLEIHSNTIQNKCDSDIDKKNMQEWGEFVLELALQELKQDVSIETYEAFYLTSIQNRPIQEVVALVGKTPNNLYNIRARCLKKLREIISRRQENCIE